MQYAQLHTLIGKLLDGQLTTGDKSELAALLQDDPAARTEYLDVLATHAALRSEFGGMPATDAPMVTPLPAIDPLLAAANIIATGEPGLTSESAARSHSPKLFDRIAPQIEPDKHLLRFAAVVAFITLGSWAYFIEFVSSPAYHRDDVARVDPKESEPEPEARIIARLVDSSGAAWEGSEQWRAGDGLSEGDTLEFEQGLAEIHYDHGVRVVLEGPCKFTIGGPKGGLLSHGKLAARVLEKGKGFIVATPTALVIDRGTEFGVSVSAGPRPDVVVRVFEGSVDLRPLADQQRSSLLGVGDSARMDGATSTVTYVQPAANLFVRSLSLVRRGSIESSDVRSAKIDVNGFADATSTTQSGWTAADQLNLNNVTFTAVGDTTLDDRVRTDNGGGSEADMWEDFIFASDSNLTTEGMDISVSGLLANTTYEVTIWAFDDSSNGDRSADWTGSNGGTTATLTFLDSPDPVDLNDYRIDITAITDESGVLTLEGRTSASGPVGTHNVFINGFEYNEWVAAEPMTASSPPDELSLANEEQPLQE